MKTLQQLKTIFLLNRSHCTEIL